MFDVEAWLSEVSSYANGTWIYVRSPITKWNCELTGQSTLSNTIVEYTKLGQFVIIRYLKNQQLCCKYGEYYHRIPGSTVPCPKFYFHTFPPNST